MSNNIVITGITDMDKYPPCINSKFCKQCMQSNIMCIPDQKPEVESINEVKVSICVNNFEVFNTVLGPKLLLNGCKNIKVLYTANNCSQSLHSAHWNIPFCEFILLKDLCYERPSLIVKEVFAGIENVCVNYFDLRTLDISILFIICPQFEKIHSAPCKKPNDCYRNYYSCKPNPCNSTSNKNLKPTH